MSTGRGWFRCLPFVLVPVPGILPGLLLGIVLLVVLFLIPAEHPGPEAALLRLLLYFLVLRLLAPARLGLLACGRWRVRSSRPGLTTGHAGLFSVNRPARRLARAEQA